VPQTATLDPVTRRDQNTVATRLAGVAATSGIYFGAARVVRGPGDADAVLPGEVIVAHAFSPALLALLPFAGALVIDQHATLSRGLILAREFRVPAVVAVPDATTRIATGDEVLVNGMTGVVNVVHRHRR
jgi:phosphohistidine swiveling domain-containing protein